VVTKFGGVQSEPRTPEFLAQERFAATGLLWRPEIRSACLTKATRFIAIGKSRDGRSQLAAIDCLSSCAPTSEAESTAPPRGKKNPEKKKGEKKKIKHNSTADLITSHSGQMGGPFLLQLTICTGGNRFEQLPRHRQYELTEADRERYHNGVSEHERTITTIRSRSLISPGPDAIQLQLGREKNKTSEGIKATMSGYVSSARALID